MRAASAAELIILVTLALHALAIVPAIAETHRSVLLVFDEDKDFPGLAAINRSLQETFRSGLEGRVEFYTESLNLSQFKDYPGYVDTLRENFRRKYAFNRPDLIVAVLEPSLDFLLRHREVLFSGVPIIFCGIDASSATGKTPHANVTGILIARTFGPTLDIALRLQPDTRNVFIVGGTAPFDQQLQTIARRDFAPFESRVHITYLTALPMADLLNAVSRLPSHSVVLYLTLLTDGAGRAFVPHEALSLIAARANAAVYVSLDQYVGLGAVGGHVYSFASDGRLAAELGLRILRGEPASTIPVVVQAPYAYMFDWRQLQRWNLDPRRLPPGSVVINREYTLWERYRAGVIIASAMLLLQTLVIMGLLIQRRERRHAEAAHRVSEEKFAKAFAGNPAAIALTRLADGVILDVNDTALQLLRYSREQVLGRSVTDLAIWENPADRLGWLEALRAAGRVPAGEVRFADSSGTPLEVLLSAELIDVAGEPLVLSTFLDLTERHRVEREAAQSRRELAHMSRVMLMGELTASLAHELKQPLTAIVTNAYSGHRFLAQPVPHLDGVREILADIVADGQRAGVVIDRVRGFLKKDGSQFRPLDLNELIREIQGLTRTDAIIRHQPITLALAPRLPAVVGDRIQLQQVLLNLILNGMDAMAGQAPAKRLLTIHTAPEATSVRVGVEDRGTGVPLDQLGQIFTAFVTTKPNGMGMGLAISRSIVEAHGGRIWAENNPEGGATFWFTLPVQSQG